MKKPLSPYHTVPRKVVVRLFWVLSGEKTPGQATTATQIQTRFREPKYTREASGLSCSLEHDKGGIHVK